MDTGDRVEGPAHTAKLNPALSEEEGGCQMVMSSHDTVTLLSGGVEAVLATLSQPRCSVMFFTDGASTLSTVTKVNQLLSSWSVSVWEVAADGQDANVTLTQLPHVVDQAQRLRQVSWCVTVVVVSDDLAFLAAFAQWSLKGRLVGPSTRLLAVTNASLVNNPDLSRTYSKMNAVMLAVDNLQQSRRCGVYLHLPYSPRGAQALKVASWTPHQGLALTSSLPLFPDKFSRLAIRPNLMVITHAFPTHEPVMVEDPRVPGGKKLMFFSALGNLTQILADTTNFTVDNNNNNNTVFSDDNNSNNILLNIVFNDDNNNNFVFNDDSKNNNIFSDDNNNNNTIFSDDNSYNDSSKDSNNKTAYTFVMPPDNQWGLQLENGTWIGTIGIASREEVDIGLGPISVSASRAQVLDFTWPMFTVISNIVGGRGRPEVDPWGFLFPLTPLVWAAILTTLLVLPLTVFLLSSCVTMEAPGGWLEYVFSFTRIFLQQGKKYFAEGICSLGTLKVPRF
nr:uncharacterized protein LOC123755105 [Procambarus clarkii]